MNKKRPIPATEEYQQPTGKIYRGGGKNTYKQYREDRFDYRGENDYYLRSNKNDVSRRERVGVKKQQTQSQTKYDSYPN